MRWSLEMNPLTSEQLKKIEENRARALQRRQNAQFPSQKSVNVLHNFDNNQSNAPSAKAAQPKIWNKPENVESNKAAICPVPEVGVICVLVNAERFAVKMRYHAQSIEIMKGINGKVFDQTTKSWTFPISEHDNVVNKLRTLKELSVTALPRNIVNCFKSPSTDSENVNIDKIDDTLLATLLPFQAEGIRYGISRKGRCLIADEMGLGKTLQALGIAHYYFEKWPLLIVCPSSMRFPWEQAIIDYLPSVNPFTITVMTSANDDINSQKVVIVSYDLMKTCLSVLKRLKFGVIIFDESHYLKNFKSARTETAQEIAFGVPHVILLSGTPALSRPHEIFPQLKLIDPAGFKNVQEFGIRYCNGQMKKYGWDFSGCSNSEELGLLLKKTCMIRRMKADVFKEMPSKIRKVVYLQPKLVNAVSTQMESFATRIQKEKGVGQRQMMLSWYSATAPAKLEAVISYIDEKLETAHKMLVFAHHAVMLDGISEMLAKKRIDFIRIDGSTPAEQRSELCERFQISPDLRVAILSLKAANAGITLTAANLVVFAELYWNPGELTQAEDRAHRIGQNESVLVEYLVAKGTADDYMIQLIGSKLNVLNRCGFSKENFSDLTTTPRDDNNQRTLTEIMKLGHTADKSSSDSQCAEKNKDDTFTSSQVGDLFSVEYESLEDAFQDDDVFDSIDLDSIQGQCPNEPKRQKLD